MYACHFSFLQWITLPLFVIYRIILFCYIFAGLIAHGVIRSDEFGAKWFIFLTDLSYLFLVIALGAVTIQCVVYAVIYHFDKLKLGRWFPKVAASQQLVYSQDNIPLYAKISWLLYTMSTSITFFVSLGYWVLIYECPDSADSETASNISISNTTPTGIITDTAACLDYGTIQVHVIVIILVFLDLFFSRMPFQLLHFFYPCFFTAGYIIFTGIYHGAGGTNPAGSNYIYSDLNYEDKPGRSAGLAIVIVIAPIAFFLILFFLARLRDLLYKKVSFCFRDIPGIGDFNRGLPNAFTSIHSKEPVDDTNM